MTISIAKLQAALLNANVQAALCVIREGESCQDHSAFTELFGGLHFGSFADHPRKVITKNGYTSSAAGAFQIIEKTWDGLVKEYGFADFSRASQEQAAVALLIRRKALDLFIAGHFDEAIAQLGYEWASLPSGKYPQPKISMARARQVYEQYGGTYATVPAPVVQPQEQEQEKPMAPFVAAAIRALMDLAPQLIKIFRSGGEVSERNAEAAQAVVDVAKQVTGAASGEEAVEKLQSAPELQQKFQQQVALDSDAWLGMITRLAGLEEDSRGKAREFVQSYDARPVLWQFTFVEVLSLIVVIFSLIGATLMVVWGDLADEMKATIITMILVGGFTSVTGFWLGSSYGSMMKNQPPRE